MRCVTLRLASQACATLNASRVCCVPEITSDLHQGGCVTCVVHASLDVRPVSRWMRHAGRFMLDTSDVRCVAVRVTWCLPKVRLVWNPCYRTCSAHYVSPSMQSFPVARRSGCSYSDATRDAPSGNQTFLCSGVLNTSFTASSAWNLRLPVRDRWLRVGSKGAGPGPLCVPRMGRCGVRGLGPSASCVSPEWAGVGSGGKRAGPGWV